MTTVTKMRLSKETYNILKNFAAINSNIMIKPGNVLKTIAPGMNIYAEAKVGEEFDIEAPIWDLNKFLGVISMFNNPELEFQDNCVVISNGRSSVTYYYAEPELLTVPKKEVPVPVSIVEFELSDQDLNDLVKASSILQVSNLKIVAADGKVSITVNDEKQANSNNFMIEVQADKISKDFEGTIKVSELRLIPGSYDVKLTDGVVGKFSHKTLDLSYLIAINRD